jgi:hypothetical protein
MDQEALAQEQKAVVEKQRYLTGCVQTINGRDISIEEMKLDLRLIKHIRLRDLHREGQLAAYLGMNMRDAAFQDSLHRLETFGMITRTIRQWDWRGYWVDLADEEKGVDNTARGTGIAVDVREVVVDLVKCEARKEGR